MREQELIEKQEATTNQTIYLMKVGMFFHAYNAGAFALARATGYRIKRKSRKGGREVLVAGFPAESLNTVVPKLEALSECNPAGAFLVILIPVLADGLKFKLQ